MACSASFLPARQAAFLQRGDEMNEGVFNMQNAVMRTVAACAAAMWSMTASIAHTSECLPEVVTPADMHREVFGTTDQFVLVYETGVSSQVCDATNMALAAGAQVIPRLKVVHYRLKRDLEKPEMEMVLPVLGLTWHGVPDLATPQKIEEALAERMQVAGREMSRLAKIIEIGRQRRQIPESEFSMQINEAIRDLNATVDADWDGWKVNNKHWPLWPDPGYDDLVDPLQ
jgi:hypothetical protein